MKKQEKTYLVLGAVALGGYLLYAKKKADKERAALQSLPKVTGGVFSLVSGLGKTITAGIASLTGKTPTVVLSQPDVQQYGKGSTYDPTASQIAFEKGVSGYYGSLGSSSSRYGSLG